MLEALVTTSDTGMRHGLCRPFGLRSGESACGVAASRRSFQIRLVAVPCIQTPRTATRLMPVIRIGSNYQCSSCASEFRGESGLESVCAS